MSLNYHWFQNGQLSKLEERKNVHLQLNQFQKHSFKESIFRFLALCKSGIWSLNHSQGHVQPP